MAGKTSDKLTPKEISLMLIVKGLDDLQKGLTREGLIDFMHEIGFSNYNVRSGGFDNVLEALEINVGRATNKAVTLLEGRAYSIETICDSSNLHYFWLRY